MSTTQIPDWRREQISHPLTPHFGGDQNPAF
jgi:hypothetical protein